MLSQKSLSLRKIMVIEDDASIRLCLVHILSNHNLVFAISGEEALELLSCHPSIELVICDYHLPGWNGSETLHLIRNRLPGMKFILISAAGAQTLSRLAMEAKADAWLNKPFSCDDLRQNVARLLTNR